MKKDIKWLKNEIKKMSAFDLDHRFGSMSGEYVSLYKINNIINQLDEIKEKSWVVELEKDRFVDNYIDAHLGVQIDVTSYLASTAPFRFKDKDKAEAVALLVDGYVVEVNK